MKNLFKNLMLVAVAAMGFASCETEVVNDVPNVGNDENTVTMTFVADAPESRTSVAINGDDAKYSWSTGDKVGFYYVDVEGTGKKKKSSNAAAITDDGTATFTASFEKIDGASAYNIGAFYPSDSWGNHAESDPFNNVDVEIPAGQALTAGTFDPNADLMMSKPFMGVALSSDDVKTLEFTRIAAIGKMNLKLEDMVAGEVIKSVKFSLAEGTNFTGPVSLDLENSSYSIVEAKASNAVTISGELAANADRTSIYFTCFPVEYTGAYTIEVTTDKATYSKNGKVTNPLSFTAGNVLNFNATVGNREEIVVAGVVDVLDLAFTGVAATTNYADWSGKTGDSGAVYAGNSAGDKNSIQLRSNNNNSGIVTTASGGFARKITVTWNSNTSSGRTLNVYGKNTAYTAATDLYNATNQGDKLGTIVYGTPTVLEITGDYEYIGLRSNSGAMYITKIMIEWESDGLTAQSLSFPQSSYTITEGDSFTAPTVTGAQTTVTYTSSDTTVATVNANTGAVNIVGVGTTTITASAEATDAYRAAEASYTLTVNEKATESSAAYVKVSSALADWTGTYLIVWDNGAHATVSGKDLIKTADVTISNNQILSTAAVDKAAVTVAKSGSSYSLKLPSGQYLSMSTNGNQVSQAATAFNLTFTWTSNGVKIIGKDGSGNERAVMKNGSYYRGYKTSSSYTLPTLYKLNN